MTLQELQELITPEFLSTHRKLLSHFEENMVDLELNDVDWDEIEYYHNVLSSYMKEVN